MKGIKISSILLLTRLIPGCINQSLFTEYKTCKEWIQEQKDQTILE